MPERPQQEDVLKWQFYMLYVGGFYPLRRDFIYYFGFFATQIISWSVMATLIIRLALDLPDVFKFLSTMRFTMTQFAFLAKGVPFLLRQEKLQSMRRDLRNPLFNSGTVEQDRFLDEAIYTTRAFGKVFWVGCTLATIFMTFNPLIDGNLMPVPAWFPFDPVAHRYKIIAFQGMGFIANAYSNSGIDLIMSGMISLMGAQVEILKEALLNLTGTEDDKEGDVQLEEEVIYRKLVRCVLHHDAILRFVDKIEDMFSLGILAQFFASILTICLTGIFLLTVGFKKTEFIGLMCYFMCMILQIVFSCWFGHDIMSKSDDLINACYMNKWYNTSPRIKEALFMIMEKAKRPVILTAGKVFTLNLTTLVGILRSSYSYFMVLYRLYGDTYREQRNSHTFNT